MTSAATSGSSTSPAAVAAARPPSIVILLADDLGYGDLSVTGHPTSRTPAIDQLARTGLRLTSFYTASPVCSPSRAGIATGRFPARSGVYCADNTYPPGQYALPLSVCLPPPVCPSLPLSASLSLLHNYMLAGPGTRVAARLTTGLRPITASAATACSCLVCLAGCQKPSSQLPSSCNREDVSGRSRTTVVSGAWLWLIRFCVARCFSEPIRLSLTDTTMMIGKWHVRLRNVSSRSGPPLSCLLYTVG